MNKKKILITGGAGYIGSHTCVALCEAGYTPILLDNFSNSSISVIRQIERLIGKQLWVMEGDIRSESLLQQLLGDHQCEAVIHFAGLKSVSDSMVEPLNYYDVNVRGSLTLLRAMQKTGVKRIVFSSSAAVYGAAEELPIKESAPCSPVNPYGRSKLIVEEMLADLARANPDWSVTSLRYFNPVGAHPSGLIGERPRGVPSNLMPYLTQTAAGWHNKLTVFGNDYPTHDGSALRDYIHVVDLAEGHVAALHHCMTTSGISMFNLGRGVGCSVFEMIDAFETTTGEKIPYKILPRRPGDVAACWADPTAAVQILKWRATRGLEAMCRDSWYWQQQEKKDHET